MNKIQRIDITSFITFLHNTLFINTFFFVLQHTVIQLLISFFDTK